MRARPIEFFLQSIHRRQPRCCRTDEVDTSSEATAGWLLATARFNPGLPAILTTGASSCRAKWTSGSRSGLSTISPATSSALAGPGLAQSFERWTLTADVVWTGWSSYDKLQIVNQDTGAVILDSPKDWDNVLGYRAGAEYQASEHWVLRGGYVYDQSPVPTRTRGLELPCNDRHMFSVGAGYTCGNWGVDVSYCYLLLKNGDAGAPMARIGDFSDAYAHMLGISFHTEF